MSEMPIPPQESLDLLLVDDEPDFLEPACRFFQRQGFHVGAAANGEQALELQRHRRFDVAVVDQNMPGMDGYSCSDDSRPKIPSSRSSCLPVVARLHQPSKR